jgi:hypothetical protein
MKKVMTAAIALSALFAASGKVHAEVNYPWCIIGNTRAVDCYFSSREQCAQDGRNRGFGGQCIKNPAYKPGKPTVSGPVANRAVSQAERPSQAVSLPSKPAAADTTGRSTCTGLRSVCLGGWANDFPLGTDTKDAGIMAYQLQWCNFTWERCMKSGFWSGEFLHRSAERR